MSYEFDEVMERLHEVRAQIRECDEEEVDYCDSRYQRLLDRQSELELEMEALYAEEDTRRHNNTPPPLG